MKVQNLQPEEKQTRMDIPRLIKCRMLISGIRLDVV